MIASFGAGADDGCQAGRVEAASFLSSVVTQEEMGPDGAGCGVGAAYECSGMPAMAARLPRPDTFRKLRRVKSLDMLLLGGLGRKKNVPMSTDHIVGRE